MKEKKIVFVILHYLTIDDTIKSIDSIKKLNYNNKEVVIVDNCSKNNTGQKLKQMYINDKNIHLILSRDNLGFAKGNNLGFKFAKEKLNADFIVMCNNDTVVLQKNFCKKVIDSYQKYNYAVLGPKIRLKDNKINGLYLNLPSEKDVIGYIKYYKKCLIMNYLGLESIVRKIKQKIFGKKENYDYRFVNEIKENIILHGCFLVFSPNYINKFNDAFDNRTFLYREEELLALRLKKENLLSLYYPEIEIYHNEETTTNVLNNTLLKKNRFIYKNQIDSCKILLEELKTNKQKKEKIKIITFYLPQFHSFPENDKWWGKGFTEWTNTKKAIPLFKKHNQPREPLNDNYYNLLEEKTMIWQSKIAKKYGIYGFCYYHYWFKGGKKLMEKPLENMLKNKKININFCLSWANESWTRRWDGLEKEVLMPQEYGDKDEWCKHFDYLYKFFIDDRYIKEDNKPIFIIYKPELIPKLSEMITCWNELAKKKGLSGIKFVYQFPKFYYLEHDNKKLFSNGIKFEPIFSDSSIEYSMLNKNKKIKYLIKNYNYLIEKIRLKFNKLIHKKYPNVFNYDRIWKNILNNKIVDNFYPGAFVDWDNSARRGYDANIYYGATPEKFKKYMKKLVKKAKDEYKKDIIFINAWNEWAEGAYLEPDKKNGFKYLEAIKEVLDEEEK